LFFYQYFPHISLPGADFFKDGPVFSLAELDKLTKEY